MSVVRVRDEFLARRAARGDRAAFVILARRYGPIIAAAVGRACPGATDEQVLRRAALLGLWQACRLSDGLSGFAWFAESCVERHVHVGADVVASRGAGSRRGVELSTALLERRQNRWRAA
jgi:hypothetical protein